MASDLRGPAITERLSVLIDADPPRVVPGTEALTIVPAAGNPLTQLGPSFAPTAVRQDSVARVSLLLDDPNTTSAQVFFGTSTTQLPFIRRVGQSFVFEGQLPATLPEGDVALEVTAIDDVGNRLARQPLVVEPRLRRDVTLPPTPDVTTA